MNPRKPLGKELEELERTNPKVKAAAIAYSEMVQRVIDDRIHPIPCTKSDCYWHKP